MLGYRFDPYDFRFRRVLKLFLGDKLNNAWVYQSVMQGILNDWKSGYIREGGEDFGRLLLEMREKKNLRWANVTDC
jgi:hypothetical protein